jgi:hypothetical protein
MEPISQYIGERLNRLMLLLTGATGLIGAAFLNGLPSITCYALAEAYKISIAILGVLFILELIGIVALEILQVWRKYRGPYKPKPAEPEPKRG